MKISEEIKEESLKRINDRNNRTLLLNLSEDVGLTNKEELSSIVPNAASVRIPGFSSRNKFLKTVFVEFDSQTIAEENFTHLQNVTLPIGSLTVAKTGLKEQKIEADVNPCGLYISGIPVEAETQELKKLFPKADIGRNESSKFRNRADYKTFAILKFSKAEDANEAFWSSENVKVLDKRLLVLYAKNNEEKSKLLPNQKNAAKMKVKRLQEASKTKSLVNDKSKNKKTQSNLRDTIKKSIEKGLIKFDEPDSE